MRRRSGLVYIVPEASKIWVLVIFGKLLRKTFRIGIGNYRSRPFLFLQRWLFADKRVRYSLPCPEEGAERAYGTSYGFAMRAGRCLFKPPGLKRAV